MKNIAWQDKTTDFQKIIDIFFNGVCLSGRKVQMRNGKRRSEVVAEKRRSKYSLVIYIISYFNGCRALKSLYQSAF